MTQQSLKGSAGEPPLLQQKNRLLPLCVSLLNLALVGSNCSPLRPLTHTHTRMQTCTQWNIYDGRTESTIEHSCLMTGQPGRFPG